MILVLQTAGAVTNLWLLPGENTTAPAAPAPAAPSAVLEDCPSLTWQSNRELADGLLSKIIELVTTRGTDHVTGRTPELTDLTGIVIFAGPGSFTSLRIGHTVANALADALKIPVANATGDRWIADALAKLPSTPVGHPALPLYGAEANVTFPS